MHEQGAGPVKIEPAFLMGLLDEVGRLRALTDRESSALEDAIKAEAKPRRLHKWTREENRELLRLQHRRRGVADYAKKIGVSESAAWSQIQVLRYPHKRRVRPVQVEK